MTLDLLRERLLVEERSPALAELSPNLVFGEGSLNAKLMLIGEAPGEDEDLQARPFVGRAGQLLDRILESVDIARHDVYITNIVKYRPPGNRNPRPEEIAASEAVLVEQIRLVRPQVIGALGNISAQYFLGTKEGITRTRGQWRSWHGIRVMPLYHPAYLLRNPSRQQGSPKWQMWQDMKAIKAVLDTLDEKSCAPAIASAQQRSLF